MTQALVTVVAPLALDRLEAARAAIEPWEIRPRRRWPRRWVR